MATIQIDSVYFRMPTDESERIFFDSALGWAQHLEREKVRGMSVQLGHDLHGRPEVELKYNGHTLISVVLLSAPEVEVTGDIINGRRWKMSLGDVFGAALCPSLFKKLEHDDLFLQSIMRQLKPLIPSPGLR